MCSKTAKVNMLISVVALAGGVTGGAMPLCAECRMAALFATSNDAILGGVLSVARPSS